MTGETRPTARGMSVTSACALEAAIVGWCVLALVAIFQPFSLTLFSIGCVLVVVGGLAFNLVPFCEPGRPVRDVLRAALVVAIVFLVVLVIALASAYGYGLYLAARQPG